MNYKVLTAKEQDENKSVVSVLYDCNNAKELQKIYHKLMMKFHPDICGDTEENKIIAQLINDTYFKLKKINFMCYFKQYIKLTNSKLTNSKITKSCNKN
jgi:hypothetical protein